MTTLISTVALLFACGSYTNGDFGALAQGLGVVVLELLRRGAIAATRNDQFFTQVRSYIRGNNVHSA